MVDYIEREAALEAAKKSHLYFDIKPIINSIPAADVRPVVRGKWIDRDDDYYGWNMWACSACGEEFVLTEGTPDMNDYHFCPNCGADMREES
jgi:hypothetical protein